MILLSYRFLYGFSNHCPKKSWGGGLPEQHTNKNRIVFVFEVPGGSRLSFQSESISDLQNGGNTEEYLGLISTSVGIEGSSVVVSHTFPVKGPINRFRGVRVTLRRVEEGFNSD